LVSPEIAEPVFVLLVLFNTIDTGEFSSTTYCDRQSSLVPPWQTELEAGCVIVGAEITITAAALVTLQPEVLFWLTTQ
jgi:hypothetical protein